MSASTTGQARRAIGLHVTLTAPFTPMTPGYGPLRDGGFLPLEAMMLAAFLQRLSHERLAIEIATQFKAFVLAFGRAPDFVDGHQHVHLFPQVRDAFLSVVKEMAPQAWVRQCGRSIPLAALRPQGDAARRAQLELPPPRAQERTTHQSGLRRRL